MKTDRALIPISRVPGQVLGLVDYGPEAGVGQCGAMAVSQMQGQTSSFQFLHHVH